MSVLKIKQVKSVIGSLERHKDTVRTLGLRRIGQVVYHTDTPQLRGMVASVAHLVVCENVANKPEAAKTKLKTGYKVIKANKAK